MSQGTESEFSHVNTCHKGPKVNLATLPHVTMSQGTESEFSHVNTCHKVLKVNLATLTHVKRDRKRI